MMKVFEMTDLGIMAYFLGMEVRQDHQGVFICQRKYAKEILKKFHMENCKSVSTPMNQNERLCKEDGAKKVEEAVYWSLIGCLMYLTTTRPDILHAVSVLARFSQAASEEHFIAAKRLLRYVKGTIDYVVLFKHGQEFNFHGFSNSDWGGSLDDMKSTSGYCFTIGSGMISWSSKKQDIVAQSTAEAEFIAATATVNQALWLRKILNDLCLEQRRST
ncbi:Xyloglucan endotransglycosylase 6 [Hibiscus syriacus]|uniref:Xyloglucan endotransglycosylase 6 n=1 Tax=Hibiscus syriacus TaxID=106335 RepID=A0A6A3BIN4_HIBSY|nr:Xyloglucan endotransglycosylase 6 [Hibiscus syriacus]